MVPGLVQGKMLVPYGTDPSLGREPMGAGVGSGVQFCDFELECGG